MARGRKKGVFTRGERARRAAIVAYHNRGERTLQEVGDHFGVTRERVRQVLKTEGIGQRHGAPIDWELHSARLRQYKDALTPGVLAKDAAASIGVTLAMVFASARALGAKVPRPKSKARLRYDEMVRLYQSVPGITGHEIAKKFGVDDNTVSHALRLNGVVTRRSGWSKERVLNGEGFLYVAKSDASGLIKIGFTLDPSWRMRNLRGPNGERFRIIATAPGTYRDELSLHAQLREHAISKRREYYAPSVLTHPGLPIDIPLQEAA